ncbi:MAG: lysophospholipid acyltransferase family protein [Pseudomonadota bacterium]
MLAGFLALTLPLMPLQALLKRLAPRAARHFPHWYHRRVCRLLGLRLNIDGAVLPDRPVLLIANHVSWLDIPVLSAVAPLSFVAKQEVGGWPVVGTLARLQRTVFVDRERRRTVGRTAGIISQRLAHGDNILLFAEGTSSDGNRVLPFKTSLFGAVVESKGGSAQTAARDADGDLRDGASGSASHQPVVQTVSLVYTRLHGIPLGRSDRPLIGWYGDMDMAPHAWRLLKAGPLDVCIRVGQPVSLAKFSDRKALAQLTEANVRSDVVALLRGGA